MSKQILPIGTLIKFDTGWVWRVEAGNKIVYPPTGQESSLNYYSKSKPPYKVVMEKSK